MLICASCEKKRVEVVHVDASVQCDQAVDQQCYSVTASFLDEHRALFVENIRLQHALRACQKGD